MAKKSDTRSAKHAELLAEPRAWVLLECPSCGNRVDVLAMAYVEGWCVGPEKSRHKPKGYVIIETTKGAPGNPGGRKCESCDKVFPKRRGRYPRLCEDCKAQELVAA